MPNNCRHILAVVLLRRHHISIFHLAITHPNRAVLGHSQASHDQSEPDIGAGQPKQLHQVSKASDSDAGRCCDLVFYVAASVSSFYTFRCAGAGEDS